MNETNESHANSPNISLTDELTAVRANLCIFIYPFIIVCGVVCNTLAVLVLTRRSMRRSPASLCLTVLAFTDSAVLIFSAGRYWAKYTLHFDPQLYHPVACRLLLFCEYFSVDFSTWILCTVTFQRFVLVRVPLRVVDLCSYKRTGIILIGVGLLVFIKDCPFLWMSRIHKFPLAGDLCQVIWKRNFWAVYSWVDLIGRLLLPFTLMLVLNVITVIRAKRASRTRRKMSAIGQLSIALHSNARGQQHTIIVPRAAENSADRNVRRMRAMLLAVNAFFLIAYAPFAALMTADGAFNLFRNAIVFRRMHDYAILSLLFQVGVTLMYLSHASNFVLYVASGGKFRAGLYDMCCPKRRRQQWLSVYQSRTMNGRPSVGNASYIVRQDE